MADASEVITGPVRDWLAAKRQELNGRFRLAQRRFPRLNPEMVLHLCRELLPPLAGTGEAGSAELLGSVYDLILLHAGRGMFATDGGSSPAIGELLRVTFPRLRPLLLARPTDLPANLSNAVENLGERGLELARGLATLAEYVTRGDELLDAGAVMAWRLGEARLRTTALEKASHLVPSVARLALGVAASTDQALPRVIAGLTEDGWRRPELVLTLTSADATPTWRLAALLGNFRGYGGHFDKPPLLLDPGDQRSRHRFWVRSGEVQYRIDADIFGWVCRPDVSVDFQVAPVKVMGKLSVTLPETATSVVECKSLVAFTVAESFRVRILTQSNAH